SSATQIQSFPIPSIPPVCPRRRSKNVIERNVKLCLNRKCACPRRNSSNILPVSFWSSRLLCWVGDVLCGICRIGIEPYNTVPIVNTSVAAEASDPVVTHMSDRMTNTFSSAEACICIMKHSS
uniref:Uncharacterized protein n=1 Tax=Anopheles atroparvus TaxID=41427 RepID=A0AAG5DPM9_ANOAO